MQCRCGRWAYGAGKGAQFTKDIFWGTWIGRHGAKVAVAFGQVPAAFLNPENPDYLGVTSFPCNIGADRVADVGIVH